MEPAESAAAGLFFSAEVELEVPEEKSFDSAVPLSPSVRFRSAHTHADPGTTVLERSQTNR